MGPKDIELIQEKLLGSNGGYRQKTDGRGGDKMTWSEIQKVFFSLSEVTGRGKPNSYYLHVCYWPDGTVQVMMGTYDIANWRRNTDVGIFTNEEVAKMETLKKVAEAAIAEAKQQQQDHR